MAQNATSVAAVVVTYNRLQLLQECITALRKQTRLPEQIIVIDNGSSDGTTNWLSTQIDVVVVCQNNTGSSGGQASGIVEAYRRGHDWFWLMDDDTIPQPEALEAMCAVPAFHNRTAGFLASIVVWTDGRCQPLTWSLEPAEKWLATSNIDNCVGTPASTFVSVLINRIAVERVGLPFRGFFLLWDDIEFTQRISRVMPGYFVLTSLATHKTPDFENPALSHSSIKLQYHQRNRVIFLRMQPMGVGKRWLKIAKFFFRDCWLLARRKIGLRHIAWTIKGMLDPCPIEYIKPK